MLEVFSSIGVFAVNLLIFIVVIGLLVFVHELGHYLAAKRVGIKVEEFALGMGPRVWGFRRGETNYNLRAFPIGGFVQMLGEGDYDLVTPDSYAGKPPSRRLFVLIAGVFMNFMLAVLLFYAQGANLDFKYRNIEGIFAEEYHPWFGTKSDPKIAIREVSDTSPLKGKVDTFDIITKVNGEDYSSENFSTFIEEHKGQEVKLEVVGYASGKTREVSVTPRTEYPKNEKALGVKVVYMSFIQFDGWEKLFAGFAQSLNTIQNFSYSLSQVFIQSFEQGSAVPVADNVGGAISIFDVLGKITSLFGFWGLLELMALLSINLAVLNILPIPALDGGHTIFTLLELISKRRLPARIYNYLTLGGFLFLITFMIFVTGLDIVKRPPLRDLFCSGGRNVSFICDLSEVK